MTFSQSDIRESRTICYLSYKSTMRGSSHHRVGVDEEVEVEVEQPHEDEVK